MFVVRVLLAQGILMRGVRTMVKSKPLIEDYLLWHFADGWHIYRISSGAQNKWLGGPFKTKKEAMQSVN